jgi:hypothetical protein
MKDSSTFPSLPEREGLPRHPCRITIMEVPKRKRNKSPILFMAKPLSKNVKKLAQAEPSAKRTYLKQQDVPSASLDEALRLPQSVLDHYAGRPTAPLYVAKALNVDPKGSQLKVL